MKDATKAEGRVGEVSTPRSRMSDLKRRETEWKRAAEAAQQAMSLLTSILESTADGILVVDTNGKVIISNKKFLSLWRIPESLAAKKDDKLLLDHVLGQLKDPGSFIEKVKQLYSHPEAESFDVLEFKDGRVFERFSQSRRSGNDITGRVWSFRDVTGRIRTEEAQRRSWEAAERLAGEMGVIAEIGRITGSTLNIEEVYERFATEAKKLIPFDRLAVNVKCLHEYTSIVTYVSGSDIPCRRQGDSTPLAGTLSEEVLRARSSLLIQPESTPEGIAEMVSRFPALSPSFQAGLFSLLSVPLIYRDEAVGVLHFRSKKERAYTEQDLILAERIGAQIAGTIANAQLFADLKKTEEEQRRNRENAERLVEEMAVIAEIGRVTGSTLNIEEVYERFAEEVRKIIPFDRIVIATINVEMNRATNDYMAGVGIADRKAGASYTLEGSSNFEVVRTKSSLLIQTEEDFDEYKDRFPRLLSTFQAGFRSIMTVPLFSKGEIMGALLLRSFKPHAYTDKDVRLAERVGNQIAGAIVNAQLFAEVKKTEMSLRESEGRFRALVEQAAVGVAEIDMATNRFLTVNRRLCEMVGRTEEEMLATTFQAITHPEDIHLHEEKTALLQAGKIGHYSLEKRYVRKDGAIIFVNITVSPLWKLGEKPGRNMVVVEDITERKRVQRENERHSKQLAVLHETSVELMAELDLNTLLQFITRRALNLIGGTNCHCYLYKPEADLMERVASAGSELTPEKTTRQRGEGLVGHIWATGTPQLVNDYHAWSGRKKEYDSLPSRALVGAPIRWGDELLGIIDTMAYLPHQYTQMDLDILGMFAAQAALAIRNARLYQKIGQISVTDELTDLFNRRGFFQLGEREFERALRFGRPLSALMLDIDHFKRVNDTYGHPVGDKVLQALADCIRQNTRGIDVAGRYGGEEFTLLLPETDLPVAIQIAERLRQSIADLRIPICRGKGDTPPIQIRINVSIGVAFMQPDIPNLSILIERADQALYRAKDSGRNRVVVWEG
ncbi:MAG: diguanylate cyclase [Syntrophales bacterium]|nr:diguanylate cyclase [Syntrophales bacterium]